MNLSTNYRSFVISRYALFMLLIVVVFATEQEQDDIIINEKEYSISWPMVLEKYLKEHPERRPPKRPKGCYKNNQNDYNGLFWGSTGNYRGYVTTFHIVDNKLYIKAIYVNVPDLNSSERDFVKCDVLDKVFLKSERYCDWFSGIIHAQIDLAENHLNSSVILFVNNGKIINSIYLSTRSTELFRTRKYDRYKMTKEYDSIFQRNKQYFDNNQDVDKYIQGLTSLYFYPLKFEDTLLINKILKDND